MLINLTTTTFPTQIMLFCWIKLLELDNSSQVLLSDLVCMYENTIYN